jgi:protein TonB
MIGGQYAMQVIEKRGNAVMNRWKRAAVLSACVVGLIACSQNMGASKAQVHAQETPFYPPQALVREAPVYPPEAAKNMISGYVVVKFDLNAEGRPVNIEVTESVPQGVFDVATVTAISKWLFKVDVDDKNRQINNIGLRVRLDFDVKQLIERY